MLKNGVLKRFVLATWNLVNSLTCRNIAALRCPWCVFAYMRCAYIDTYSVGSVLFVLQVRAIPEPQVAEQQQCSPAFVCIYLYMRKELYCDVQDDREMVTGKDVNRSEKQNNVGPTVERQSNDGRATVKANEIEGTKKEIRTGLITEGPRTNTVSYITLYILCIYPVILKMKKCMANLTNLTKIVKINNIGIAYTRDKNRINKE